MSLLDKKNKEVTIFVNGSPEVWNEKEISYSQVVTLAYPDYPQHPERNYSVTYERGHGSKPTGILPPDDYVKVKNGMKFKVKFTGQS